MRRAAVRRPGKVLVMFVMLLTVLFGMVGLVVDIGMMMSVHRRTQNAADSAAVAAATDLMRGATAATATTTATTFVQTHNGLGSAAVTVNTPPAAGPHAGSNRHVEVSVSTPYSTMFAHIAGLTRNQTVAARAVAGYEALSSGEGAIVLNPVARPGLAISGGATLRVNGAVVVNSMGAGLDQYGNQVNLGVQQYALTTSNNSTVQSRYLQVVGGVDVVANYQPFEQGGQNPLFCRATVGPDPLRDLPVPRPNNVTSITNWTRQLPINVTNGQTVTLNPGVYEDIQVNAGGTLTLNPGVYILCPDQNNQGFRLNGACTVTGNGIMMYLTGSNYLDTQGKGNSVGFRDAADDAQASLDGPLPPTNDNTYIASDPPIPPTTDGKGNVKFASLNLNATSATVTLSGLNDATSPFNGVLFFQRRRNATSPSIAGNAGQNVNLTGTIYAKWANFQLSGGGRYDAQFVVGSMSISGQATVTINANGKGFGRANQVFLVE